MYFTLSIPCITIQLLQFETTNALSSIKVTTALQHASFDMFWGLLVHHQGAKCRKRQTTVLYNCVLPDGGPVRLKYVGPGVL